MIINTYNLLSNNTDIGKLTIINIHIDAGLVIMISLIDIISLFFQTLHDKFTKGFIVYNYQVAAIILILLLSFYISIISTNKIFESVLNIISVLMFIHLLCIWTNEFTKLLDSITLIKSITDKIIEFVILIQLSLYGILISLITYIILQKHEDLAFIVTIMIAGLLFSIQPIIFIIKEQYGIKELKNIVNKHQIKILLFIFFFLLAISVITSKKEEEVTIIKDF